MNESEPKNVPPSDPAVSGGAAVPPTSGSGMSGNGPGGKDATPEPAAAPPATVPPEGGAVADSKEAEPRGDGASPGGPGQSGGEESSVDGDGKKRRRRRRRRRRPAAGEGEGATEGAEAQASTDGDGAGDASGGEQAPGTGESAAGEAAKGERQQPKARQPKQKKKKPRPTREGARNDRRRGGNDSQRGSQPGSQHNATVAVRALADMARQLLHVEGVDPLAMPRYLDLQLRVPLDGGNDIRHAAGTAVEQILQRVRDVREHEKALRPGAVYSYFSDSSHEEGCRPIEPRHVFDGYSSTGKPKFADFVTLAIERKDPDIERMLAGDEIILTHVTMGRVLRTQQLAEFGGNSPVFKILGQVNAGLFPVLGEAGRCAFSFQLLRGKTLEGRVRLRLHPVGAVDPMDLADPALMQILSRFQRKLDTEALRLEGKLKGGEVDEEEFVLPLLQDFARQLQNRTRNTGRRTQHGMDRSEGGQRPTAKAYPDAGEASDSSILWDIDESTVVVLGPKGRVHVFSPQAKHVTSVVMQRPAVERRRQQGRWRLAEPEERGEFRIQIKQLIASGKDSVQGDAEGTKAGDGGSNA